MVAHKLGKHSPRLSNAGNPTARSCGIHSENASQVLSAEGSSGELAEGLSLKYSKFRNSIQTATNPWQKNWLEPTSLSHLLQLRCSRNNSKQPIRTLLPLSRTAFVCFPALRSQPSFIYFPLFTSEGVLVFFIPPTVCHLHRFSILETQGVSLSPLRPISLATASSSLVHSRFPSTLDSGTTKNPPGEKKNTEPATRTYLNMRNVQLLFSLILSIAAFSASADPRVAVPQAGAVVRRADDPTKTTGGSNGAPTAGEGDPIEGDATPTEEPKDQKTGESGSAKPSSTKSKKISSDAQPGGVVMQTPALTDGYQIYKIGQPVTFKWNYTSIQASPTAINVEAFCTDGATYFNIAANVSADTTEVVWDTGDYQQTATAKLPVATYTLWVYDASKDRTAVPSPGYLYSYNSLQFGMYLPKAPVPLQDFRCSACDFSSAGLNDPRTVRALLGMGLVTAFTFVWFIAGVL
ncbi:unnamed protein product [Tuber aestivum]|uniref:DUF7137 domain-containing protein n=1 Tax=Tuber aestivum TaxID=59557 RepID=A0A292PTL6_9PEZI|nr:unnamed protein product [Tuber aestivum]